MLTYVVASAAHPIGVSIARKRNRLKRSFTRKGVVGAVPYWSRPN